MPAKSQKQFKFMQMIAHNKKRAKEVGMSQEAAKEYTSSNVGEKSYNNLPKYSRIKKAIRR